MLVSLDFPWRCRMARLCAEATCPLTSPAGRFRGEAIDNPGWILRPLMIRAFGAHCRSHPSAGLGTLGGPVMVSVPHFDDIGQRGVVCFPGVSIFKDAGRLLRDLATKEALDISMPSDTPPPVRMVPVSTTRASMARVAGWRCARSAGELGSPSAISRLVVAGRPARSPAAPTIMLPVHTPATVPPR